MISTMRPGETVGVPLRCGKRTSPSEHEYLVLPPCRLIVLLRWLASVLMFEPVVFVFLKESLFILFYVLR
jgi:hypothetical protein